MRRGKEGRKGGKGGGVVEGQSNLEGKPQKGKEEGSEASEALRRNVKGKREGKKRERDAVVRNATGLPLNESRTLRQCNLRQNRKKESIPAHVRTVFLKTGCFHKAPFKLPRSSSPLLLDLSEHHKAIKR